WAYKLATDTGQLMDFVEIFIDTDDPYGNFSRLKRSVRPWTHFLTVDPGVKVDDPDVTLMTRRIPRAPGRGNIADVAALPAINRLNEKLTGATRFTVRYSEETEKLVVTSRQECSPAHVVKDGDVIQLFPGAKTQVKPITSKGRVKLWEQAIL